MYYVSITKTSWSIMFMGITAVLVLRIIRDTQL